MTAADEGEESFKEDIDDLDVDDNELADEEEIDTTQEESSEFALKMINSVKAMNSEQISHYEMVNDFTLADELKCLFLFIKSLPHSPIIPMYPETPFLFFKGVVLPKSFNLTEDMATDIETFMKGKNSEYFNELHLHDLTPYYLDAYESAVRIYNDMVDKARISYMSSVKQAKSQVIEISAAIVCGFVIILALISMT